MYIHTYIHTDAYMPNIISLLQTWDFIQQWLIFRYAAACWYLYMHCMTYHMACHMILRCWYWDLVQHWNWYRGRAGRAGRRWILDR